MATTLQVVFLLLLPCLAGAAVQELDANSDDFFDQGETYPTKPQTVDAPHRPWALNFGAGKITTTVGAADDKARAVIVQNDGSSVLIGPVGNGTDDDFAAARYFPDGELDTSFHTDGKVVTAVGSNHDVPHAIVAQTDGKYVLAGRGKAYNVDFAVVRYLSSGALDTSFSTTGLLTFSIQDNTDVARAIAVQTDGSLIVGGYTWLFGQYNYALARVTAQGVLDTSFNRNGKVTSLVTQSGSGILSVEIQTDGAVVVAGPVFNGADWDFGLARYTSAGAFDTSFSLDGFVNHGVNATEDRNYALAVYSDGTISAVGLTDNGSDYDFAVTRYLTSGSLDTAFSNDGKTTVSITSAQADTAFGVKLQSDGKPIVAGYTYGGANNDFALLRLHTDGALDTGFNSTGKIVLAVNAAEDTGNAIAMLGDDVIVIAGQTRGASDLDFGLARFGTDGKIGASGALDFSFGTGGKVTLDNGGTEISRTIAIQPNGYLITGGREASPADLSLQRFKLDGTLDTSFHTDGQVQTDSNGTDYAESVVLQTDGRIVAGGTNGTIDFLMIRYLTDGSLDTSFSTTGKKTVGISGSDVGNYLIMQTDGRLVLSGYEGTTDFAAARVLTSGSMDTSFHTDGIVTTDISGNDSSYGSVLQTDGNIVLVGINATIDVAMVRYSPDGSLDTAFHTDGIATTDVSGSDYGYGISLQDGGKLVVSGYHDTFAGFVGRYTTDGILDTSFHTDGTSDGGGQIPYLNRTTPNQKIVTTALSSNDFRVARFGRDGVLDTTFGSSGQVSTNFSLADRPYELVFRPNGKICLAGEVVAQVDIGIACYWP